jgi:two-component system KDP operon response regulator KdpE
MGARMTASDAKTDILIIDDEVQIRRLLRLTLESAGYHVREAENGALGLNEAAVRRPDAVVLDLSLPDRSGLDVLRRLREWSQVPVLILSVRSGEADKIAVLDAGADDYLTKPFGGGELLARVRVLLRRAQPASEVSVVHFGDVEVDFTRRAVSRAGAEVRLTAKEYALLRLLLQHRGKVLTHRQILRELWGPKAEEQTHYLRVYMAHLRQKLEDEPNRPKYFKTESGIGYRLAAE